MHKPTAHKRNKVFIYWVEIVGTCNLRCPTCATGNFLDTEFNSVPNPTGFMKVSLFKQILEKIKTDNVSDRTEIHLHTWGEPLLNPKVAEFITLTKEAGYLCGVSSNLNLDKSLKEVIKADPEMFRVSVSGFYQENYSKTHKRGDIKVVKANMYRLRHLIDQYKSKTEVQVLYHVYKHNAGDDLLMMMKLCDELKFTLDPVWAFYTPLEKSLAYLNGNATDADLETISMLAVDPSKATQAALPYKDQDCDLRKTHMTINIDGSVQLCNYTYDNAYVVAPSFVDTSHMDLQQMRYSNDMCRICMDNAQHVYPTYLVGDGMDKIGEAALCENDAKFIFKQHSEPRLALRRDHMSDAIALPRYPAPKVKQNRGLRRIKNMILGKA